MWPESTHTFNEDLSAPFIVGPETTHPPNEDLSAPFIVGPETTHTLKGHLTAAAPLPFFLSKQAGLTSDTGLPFPPPAASFLGTSNSDFSLCDR